MFSESNQINEIVGDVFNIKAETVLLNGRPGNFEFAFYIDKEHKTETGYSIMRTIVERKNGSYESALTEFAYSNKSFITYIVKLIIN